MIEMKSVELVWFEKVSTFNEPILMLAGMKLSMVQLFMLGLMLAVSVGIGKSMPEALPIVIIVFLILLFYKKKGLNMFELLALAFKYAGRKHVYRLQ
jgi:hypothetical protein